MQEAVLLLIAIGLLTYDSESNATRNIKFRHMHMGFLPKLLEIPLCALHAYPVFVTSSKKIVLLKVVENQSRKPSWDSLL